MAKEESVAGGGPDEPAPPETTEKKIGRRIIRTSQMESKTDLEKKTEKLK